MPRKSMNWFHPLVWVQIETTCQTVGWPFSPMDIKRYLVHANRDQFQTLHPQRISEWIDKGGNSSLRFTEYVQRKIGTSQVMEPGGHSSRIGILVSVPSRCALVSPDYLLGAIPCSSSVGHKAVEGDPRSLCTT